MEELGDQPSEAFRGGWSTYALSSGITSRAKLRSLFFTVPLFFWRSFSFGFEFLFYPGVACSVRESVRKVEEFRCLLIVGFIIRSS